MLSDRFPNIHVMMPIIIVLWHTGGRYHLGQVDCITGLCAYPMSINGGHIGYKDGKALKYFCINHGEQRVV